MTASPIPAAHSPLISAQELHDRLAEVTVLDVRWRLGAPCGPDEHAAGHLPGAAYVDLDADLAAAPGAGGRHPLPSRADFEAAMRRVGVGNRRPVVVYDDWSGLAAARAWWLLRFHGHPDVRLLDGGWSAWRTAGGAVEVGPVVSAPGDFTARPGQLPVVEADQVLSVPVLVDARAPERFRGEVEPIDPVAGHIPGARNVPTTRTLDEHGRLRPARELLALYAAAGALPGTAVAAYCGSGVTAAHAVLTMQLAGIEAALYPGSWSGWITNHRRPVETG